MLQFSVLPAALLSEMLGCIASSELLPLCLTRSPSLSPSRGLTLSVVTGIIFFRWQRGFVLPMTVSQRLYSEENLHIVVEVSIAFVELVALFGLHPFLSVDCLGLPTLNVSIWWLPRLWKSLLTFPMTKAKSWNIWNVRLPPRIWAFVFWLEISFFRMRVTVWLNRSFLAGYKASLT